MPEFSNNDEEQKVENIDLWDEMMKTSNLLKQKYSFLSDFMTKNRIY